ncbi:hypothetical protein [Mycobacteroides abscessus]|uniref:hypothetical protein n=1 Tax=Mycobacteroides abscessus TaxID=36809 RepID=UPI000C2677B0|nr:hypothetical protein [Mycobacteroides abscessus]
MGINCKVTVNPNGIGWQTAAEIEGGGTEGDPNGAPVLAGFRDEVFLFTYEGWKKSVSVQKGKVNGAEVSFTPVQGSAQPLGRGLAATVFDNTLWSFFVTVTDDEVRSKHLAFSRYLPELNRFEQGAEFHVTYASSLGQPCAVAYDGELWVFYHDTALADVRYVTWDGTGAPEKPSNWKRHSLESVKTYQPVSAAVFLDRLYLAYMDGSSGAIELTCYKAGDWSRPMTVFSYVSEGPSLAVARGVLYVIARSGQDFLQCRAFDGNAFGPVVEVNSADSLVYGSVRSTPYPVDGALVAAYRGSA